MPRPKMIDVSTAVALAREYGVLMSRPTVIKYVRRYDMGHQIGGEGGRWVIHRDKFRRFIRGQNESTINEDYRRPDPAEEKDERREPEPEPESEQPSSGFAGPKSIDLI